MSIKSRNERKSQDWYFDGVTKTIKNKLNDQSLDMRNTWAYIYGMNQQWYQLWRYNAQKKHLYNQRKKVLDIDKSEDTEGRYLRAEDPKDDKASQRWNITYADKVGQEADKGWSSEYGMMINKPFYVQSRQWLEKVWYANNNRHIYMRDRLDKSNSQYQRNTWFYDHRTKTIRNADKDWKDKYAFDVRATASYMHPIDSRWYQMFEYDAGYFKIETKAGEVLTVQHHDDNNDRHVIREKKQNQEEDWQMWDIIYTDNVPEGYEDGEFNAKWGFYVGKPFYIVSMWGEERFVDIYDGTNLAIKTRNGRPSQLWYFDGVTKTIKTKSRAGVSMDIRSNWGQVHGTGQQWHQLFRYNSTNNHFYNQRKRVMDVHQQKDIEGQRLHFENPVDNRESQSWQIIYEESLGEENKTGMTRFGWVAGKPFYV